VEWKHRLNAEISQSEKKLQRFRRNLKDCLLRFTGSVLTIKLACATLCVYNGVERAFKLRNISIRSEITKFSSKFECLRFAICRYCFDVEIGVHYVLRVEWSGKSV
jgi:hypothetical protein